jgi:hypothetical protein
MSQILEKKGFSPEIGVLEQKNQVSVKQRKKGSNKVAMQHLYSRALVTRLQLATQA